MEEQELFQNLKSAITMYDKILFFPWDEEMVLELLVRCSQRIIKKRTILISKETVYCYSNIVDCIQLDEERAMILRHFYHTYEFSNKFTMLSTGSNFGTIWNYVRTGILTSEEVLSAVLD